MVTTYQNYLLENGYEVHGTVRRASLINTYRIDELISSYRNGELTLHYSDLLDSASLSLLINRFNQTKFIILQPNHMSQFHLRTLYIQLRLVLLDQFQSLKQ